MDKVELYVITKYIYIYIYIRHYQNKEYIVYIVYIIKHLSI